MFKNILGMYVEGFRNMKLGKTLWLVIFIKLFVMFAVLKVFIYDTSLRSLGTQEAKSKFVLENLTKE
ncbi:DUF4492 domain-containing protein [Helicobacter winghamensis]|uniref:DUF4492 domain-containing protein n=1 Tax=Helicobacter winghamensis TaxID=157268 RepID=A0A2N3PKM4_9HELI|nr:DUF4492 domain-containing protein [Helicobacter winghamensis]EEO25998.1 hypothetical protein HWAG_00790 [Helicobacter winghamensis ATCC BAA-430]PKT77008.1 DUF4492 domain-containing protein [Helicobacter winghamensis]PKT77148.1 DUF4492 domain-containing protein [Helicobacter winghamensis]PKT77708.1 DUF4492 domain-containing protein [Helicobacter winghamensis]PKT81946.1 DUF4492 domain-containing protein [Helicobacter winghamensis]